MKRKVSTFFLVSMLTASTLLYSGCGDQSPKADSEMLCTYSQSIEGMDYDSTVHITYVKESGQMISGTITHQYEGYPKDEASNKVLTDMTVRKSILDDVDGVELELNRTDTGFGSKETWDYSKIDLESIIYTDELQEKFIDKNKGYYSQNMAKKYYESHNYGCSVSDLHS